MVGVLKDSDRAHDLGRRAAATVRERYGWRAVADSFLEACGRAVERHRGLSNADLKAREAEVA